MDAIKQFLPTSSVVLKMVNTNRFIGPMLQLKGRLSLEVFDSGDKETDV